MAERGAGRLLFVYNADGGAVSAVVDALHKLVSPRTYSCSLCAITYGAVAMRSEWKRYIARLPHPATFLHRDEFRAAFPGLPIPLPAILFQPEHGETRVLVRADEMNREQSVAQLIELLDRALARHAGQRV